MVNVFSIRTVKAVRRQTDGRLAENVLPPNAIKPAENPVFLPIKRLIDEFNALEIAGMPAVTTLCSLSGVYGNLEYALPNGEKIKLLDDTKVYLGYQVEKENSDRCYGLVADNDYLLVCEYGCNGADPEIIVYK